MADQHGMTVQRDSLFFVLAPAPELAERLGTLAARLGDARLQGVLGMDVTPFTPLDAPPETPVVVGVPVDAHHPVESSRWQMEMLALTNARPNLFVYTSYGPPGTLDGDMRRQGAGGAPSPGRDESATPAPRPLLWVEKGGYLATALGKAAAHVAPDGRAWVVWRWRGDPHRFESVYPDQAEALGRVEALLLTIYDAWAWREQRSEVVLPPKIQKLIDRAGRKERPEHRFIPLAEHDPGCPGAAERMAAALRLSF